MEPTWDVILAIMDAAGAMGGPLNGNLVMLIKEDFDPSRELLLADVVEADFNGYARSTAVVWDPAYIGADEQVHLTAPGKPFLATDGVIPNTIFGWALLDSGGTIITAAFRYDNPIAISRASDGVVVQPDYPYGS